MNALQADLALYVCVHTDHESEGTQAQTRTKTNTQLDYRVFISLLLYHLIKSKCNLVLEDLKVRDKICPRKLMSKTKKINCSTQRGHKSTCIMN